MLESISDLALTPEQKQKMEKKEKKRLEKEKKRREKEQAEAALRQKEADEATEIRGIHVSK